MDEYIRQMHKRALYQLYKSFEQDIDEYGEIAIDKRGYEIIDNSDGDMKRYKVVLYIERS